MAKQNTARDPSADALAAMEKALDLTSGGETIVSSQDVTLETTPSADATQSHQAGVDENNDGSSLPDPDVLSSAVAEKPAQDQTGVQQGVITPETIEQAIQRSLDDLSTNSEDAPVSDGHRTEPFFRTDTSKASDFAVEEAIAAMTAAIAVPNASLAQSSGPRFESRADEPILPPGRVQSPIARPREPVSPSSRPANDPRPSIGQILQALQVRPSHRPTYVAAFCSLFWLGLCIPYAILNSASIFVSDGVFSSVLKSTLLSLGMVGPVIFMFVVAALMRRSQEIRITARSMTEVAIRLAEPESMASEQVLTLSQTIRREVAAMGDGIERALARASELETMVRSEVSNLERSYTDNERRIRALIDQLASEREAITLNADRMHVVISGVQNTLAKDLESASTFLADSVGEAGVRVVSEIQDKTDSMTSVLGEAGHNLTQTITHQTEILVNQLAQTRSDIHEAVVVRGDVLVQNLTGQSTALNDMLDAATRHVRETVTVHGQSLVETITGEAHELAGRLEAIGGNISDAVIVHSNALEDRLNETGNRLASAIDDRGTLLHDNFERAGEAMTEAMYQHRNAITEQLESHTNSLHERFAETAGEAIMAIGMHGDRINETLSERLGQFESTVLDQGGSVTNRIASLSHDFTEAVVHQLGSVEKTFSTHGGALVDRLGERARLTAEELDGHIRQFDDRSTSKSREVAENLEQLIGKIDSGLEARVKTLNEVLASRALEVARVLGEGGREVTRALDARAKELDAVIVGRSTTLTQTISDKTKEINSVLGDRASEIADTLDGRIARFEDSIVRRLDVASAEVELRGKAVSESLSARLAEIGNLLAQHQDSFDSSFGQSTHNLDSVISGRLAEIKTIVDQCAKQLDETFGAHTGGLGTTLLDRLQDFTQNFGERAERLDQTLDQRGQQLHDTLATRTNELHGLFDTKGVLLIEFLSSRGSEISRDLSTIVESVADAIDQRSNALIEHLEKRRGELAATIDKSGEGLRNSVEISATKSVATLLSANDQMKTQMVTVLDQLGQTNTALQRVLGDAGQNLLQIENGLVDRLNEFDRAFQAVSDQISKLNTTTTSTIGDAGEIAARIEEHGRILNTVSSELIQTQQGLDATLAHRQRAVEGLVVTLNDKTEDLESLARAFSTVVENSFRETETRVRELSAFLSDSTQNTAGAINNQYDVIRQMTAEERERTAQALREAYEQTTADLHQIFSGSTEQFRIAAQDMRSMALDIQRDLELTRHEVRSHTSELPRETAEQAAAMNRVFSDQIKALSELSSFVNKSGRAVDISDANAAPVKAAATRGEPRRMADSANYASTRAPDSRPADSYRQGDNTLTAPRFELPSASSRTKTSSPASGDRSQKGWVSDLLSRASGEQSSNTDDRPASSPFSQLPPLAPALASPQILPKGKRPDDAMDSLDNLSADISRLIDHNVAADLWERYRRGERNLFSKRIYTMQGQKAFEDINRRYKSDLDFRDTVDRYTQEFERLLSEVAREDRDGNTTSSYLTSDTGKVYTMLAHAAGRFG